MKESLSNKKMMSFLISMVLIVTVFSSFVAADNNIENSIISLEYNFEQPLISQIIIDDKIYDEIIIPGLEISRNPGEPCLPIFGANILIPQSTEIESIEITGEKISLGDDFLVVPAGEFYRTSEGDPLNPLVMDDEIYNSNNPYPAETYFEVGTQFFRGYQILVLRLNPVQYIPNSGELFYYPNIEVIIHTKETNEINPLFRGLESDKYEAMQKVDNPIIAESYKINTNANNFASYDLLILTTDSLSSAFNQLKTFHNSHGIDTIIKTTSDVGSTNPDDIRDYITDAYTNWNINYVIIGADDDIIPAKDLYVQAYGGGPIESNMPSDIYYGCLDGTFNSDGDGNWGEPNDGPGGSDVDLIAEVYYGRACAGTTNEVNNFVDKTIDYWQASGEYLKEVLWVGEWLGFGGIVDYGGNAKDEIIEGSSNHGYTTVGVPTGDDGYNVNYLYERDMNWGTSDIMGYMNDGINFLNHFGHGSPDYAMHMYNPDCLDLVNTDYFFVYSQTCLAGHLDGSPDCWAEQMSVKTQHGAFGLVMNARYGWGMGYTTDGPSHRFDREFWDAVFNTAENKAQIGIANQDSKEDNLYRINEGCMRWCTYGLNLFGDPTVEIKGAGGFMVDFDWTPEYPRTNEPVYFNDNSAGATSRQWNFGDGTTSSEKNPIHYYSSEGIYDVKLTIYGGGETTSLTKTIEIWDNWPPHAIAAPEFYAGNNPTVCFDGSSSWDPDGTIASYHWDFKDGYTSTQISPCHTFNNDGIYFVSLTITDSDGKSDTTSVEIRIDTQTPPVTDVLLQGSPGNNGWYKSSIQIVFSATDWTGVDYTMYKIDDGDWKYFSSPEKVYVDGSHNVEFYSVDIFGNIENTHSVDFKMDSVKPTLNIDIQGTMENEWYVTPVTVTCFAEDGCSGLFGIFYKFEDTSLDDEWQLYEEPIIIDQDGNYILRIYSEDIAGNTRGKGTPHPMKIDTGAPTTTCNFIGEGSNGNYYQQVDIELTAQDHGSGVDSTYYQLDGGGWTEYTNIIEITTHGSHTFECYSTDILGNEETPTTVEFNVNNINFNLDITKPENGLYLFGNKFINLQNTIIIGGITVEATLTPYGETPANVDYIEFLVDGVVKETVETAPYEWNWDETTFGKHTLKTIAYNEGESIEDSKEVTTFIF